MWTGFTSSESNTTELMKCHLQNYKRKYCVVCHGAFSFVHSEECHLPCCELPFGDAHGKELKEASRERATESHSQWGTENLGPTTCEELNPANNQVSKLGSRSSSVGPGDKTAAPTDTLTATSWETLSQSHLATPRFLTYRYRVIINVHCSKWLNFGVIWNNRHLYF